MSRKTLTVSVVLSLGMLAQAASAAIVFSFTSAGSYSGNPPDDEDVLFTLVIQQAGANNVTVTSTVTDAVASLAVDQWAINSTIDPSLLTFSNVSGPTPTFTTGPDCCKQDGTGGDFDIQVAFPTALEDRLKYLQPSTINISGIGLTEANFLVGAEDSDFLASIHAIGYGASFWGSETTPESPVPEISGAAMSATGGLGMAVMAWLSRRRRMSLAT